MATGHKTEDVISFARLILYGSEQSWGRSWHQREIDGLFYNHFLNPDFQTTIQGARIRSFGQEDAPYPCQWNSESAESEFVQPWGANGSLDDLDEYFIGGNERQVALWNVGSAVNEISQHFGLQEIYLICSLVHGSPVPFKRLYAFGDYNPPVSFRVQVYALPFHSGERNWVEWLYEDFRRWASGFAEKFGSEITGLENLQSGANVRADMRQNPPHLEVVAHPPFVSPKIFIQLIQEAVARHKSKIVGSASTGTVIREWTIYLLSTYCGLNNRKAISLWNESFGEAKDLQYNMANNSVTNTGEQQFSRDKARLENRIEHYRTISDHLITSQIT